MAPYTYYHDVELLIIDAKLRGVLSFGINSNICLYKEVIIPSVMRVI